MRWPLRPGVRRAHISTMRVLVKICGVSTPEAAAAAVEGGAGMVGLAFFAKSPRYVTPERAIELARAVPVRKVGFFVDADDAAIDAALPALDLLQLHGHETPERVADLRKRTGKPVIKAVPLAVAADVAAARRYEGAADWLLFDAKPAPGAPRPGGNGVPFDWTLLAGTTWTVPWLLSGGLTPENVAAAVQATGAEAVDVSSGVESAPGRKDLGRIAAFLDAVRRL
jgi:phosphoribosylanthranilate isomerase